MIFTRDLLHREGIIHAVALIARPILPTNGVASDFEREHFCRLIWRAIVDTLGHTAISCGVPSWVTTRREFRSLGLFSQPQLLHLLILLSRFLLGPEPIPHPLRHQGAGVDLRVPA